MEERYERAVVAADPVNAAMQRLHRLSEEALRKKALFLQWFEQVQPQAVRCPHHHECILPFDFEASWVATARGASNRIIHSPCPQCQMADAKKRDDERLVRRGCGDDIKHCSFDNFQPETAREEKHLASCREWAGSPAGFLVFYGNIGCGKSHLLASILRFTQRGRYRRHEQIVAELRGGYGSDVAHHASKAQFEATKGCSLLCWDEFGLGASGADIPDMIQSILYHRFENRLPTVMAFNGGLAPFKALIGDRLESRLREFMAAEPLFFDGRDRRGRKTSLKKSLDSNGL